MEVVDIKRILVPNLLIHIYLHCVRSSSWCAKMLATLMKMHVYENKNVGCLRKYFHPLCHANKWLWYPIKLSWWRGFYLWFFVNLVYACIGFNFQACSFGKLTWLQFDIQNYSSAPTLTNTLTLQISTKYVFRVKTEF